MGQRASAHPVTDADRSAGALARDLGWTRACAPSGTRPTCRLAPAIQFIGYDGYPRHGSPRTCTGGCPAPLHLSWVSPCYGTSRLSAPCASIMVFAVAPSRRPPTDGRGPSFERSGRALGQVLECRCSGGDVGERRDASARLARALERLAHERHGFG